MKNKKETNKLSRPVITVIFVLVVGLLFICLLGDIIGIAAEILKWLDPICYCLLVLILIFGSIKFIKFRNKN